MPSFVFGFRKLCRILCMYYTLTWAVLPKRLAERPLRRVSLSTDYFYNAQTFPQADLQLFAFSSVPYLYIDFPARIVFIALFDKLPFQHSSIVFLKVVIFITCEQKPN